jgi:hypothetical protein
MADIEWVTGIDWVMEEEPMEVTLTCGEAGLRNFGPSTLVNSPVAGSQMTSCGTKRPEARSK